MEAHRIMNRTPFKAKPASGAVTLATVPYQGFAANDPRVHQGCSGCSYDITSAQFFAYNDRNQLEEYKTNDQTIANYQYDYRNLRTQKSLTSGTSNLYHYDLNGRRIQHDQDNQSHTSTVYLGWQPVAHIEHEANGNIKSITYLTSDQVGAPRLGTSQNKTVVWQWEADAFGTTQPNADVDNDGQQIVIENRFPGAFYDSESGYLYNHHRYLDTEKNRYISSDWIGLPGGLNTYLYAYANPLIFIDPMGLEVVARGSFSAAFGVGVNATVTISDSGITVAASGVVGLGLSGTFVGGVQASHNPSPDGYGFGLSGGLGGAFNIWGKGNADGKGGTAGGGIGVGLGASGIFKPLSWGIGSHTYDWDDIFDSIPTFDGFGNPLDDWFGFFNPDDPCSRY